MKSIHRVHPIPLCACKRTTLAKFTVTFALVESSAAIRADGMAERFYSMSAQIEAERKENFRRLENSQGQDTDITFWLEWFFEYLGRTIAGADESLSQSENLGTYQRLPRERASTEGHQPPAGRI